MYQSGRALDQTLMAWESVEQPEQLVHARRFELVQRLPEGSAAQLLAENLKRPTAGLLRARIRRDRLGALSKTGVDRHAVGVLLPLSGKLKRVGEAILRGIRLAVESHTTLIIRDTAGRSDTVERHLLDLEARGVIAILGPVVRSAAHRAARVAEDRRLPVLRLNVEEIAVAPREWAFRAFLSRRSQCRALAEYALKRGLKRWAILYADSAFGQLLASTCEAVLVAAGGDVKYTRAYPPRAPSLTEVAKELKVIPFDALFIADVGRRAGLVLRFLAREDLWTLGAKRALPPNSEVRFVQILAPSEWRQNSLLHEDKRYGAGVVVAAEWPGADAKASTQLSQEMQTGFGHAPGVFEAVGYDALRVIQAADAKSRSALAAELRRENGFNGVLGRVRFDENGEPVRQVRIYRVGAKGFQLIKR
jgi:ABC-type branched-subunit amino acid transport system substrate-binding protein